MFAQIKFRTWRFHSKLKSCQNFVTVKLLSYVYMFVYSCVTVLAAIVSTDMSCVSEVTMYTILCGLQYQYWEKS